MYTLLEPSLMCVFCLLDTYLLICILESYFYLKSTKRIHEAFQKPLSGLLEFFLRPSWSRLEDKFCIYEAYMTRTETNLILTEVYFKNEICCIIFLSRRLNSWLTKHTLFVNPNNIPEIWLKCSLISMGEEITKIGIFGGLWYSDITYSLE